MWENGNGEGCCGKFLWPKIHLQLKIFKILGAGTVLVSVLPKIRSLMDTKVL